MNFENFIYFYNEDILCSLADAIIIPVNCVGVPGAGLAKQAVKKYPEMKSKYVEYCKESILKPGVPQVITYPRKMVLFPTKNHWRNKSKMEWITQELEKLSKTAAIFTSLAIPPIGCGLGGLNWTDVEKHIKSYFKDSLCEIHIYCPNSIEEDINLLKNKGN